MIPTSLRIADRCLFYVLAAFLVLAPLIASNASERSPHDVARLGECVLLLVSTFEIGVSWITEGQRFRPLSAASVLLLYILAIASALHSKVPHVALREVVLFSGLGFLTLSVARLPIPYRRSIERGCALSMGIYSAVVLGLLGIVLFRGTVLRRWDLFLGYDNVRFFNHAQTAALPLIAATLEGESDRRWKSVSWFALITGCAFLAFSVSRATTVAIMIAGLFSVLLFRAQAVPLIKRLALGAMGGYGLYLGLLVWLPHLLGVTIFDEATAFKEITGDHSRFYLWQLAYAGFRSSPWLGVGPMHLAHEVTAKAAHPHNVYLQLAAEYGLLAFCLVVSCCFFLMLRFANAILRSYCLPQQKEAIALFTGCVAIFVDGFFSGNFVMPISQVWIAVTFGCSLNWYRFEAGSVSDGSRQMSCGFSVGAAFLLVFCQALLLWVSLHEARDGQPHIDCNANVLYGDRATPRFWIHGAF